MSVYVHPDRDLSLQGHYAGIVTRFVAFVFDLVTIAVLFAGAGAVVEFVASALVGHRERLSDAPTLSVALLAAWAFFYWAYPLAVGGRTFGMAVVGLRAVRVDGTELSAGQAVLRVLAFPLSFALAGLGFLLILVRRDRRALHDLISGAAVVYAWDAKAARLRFLARV